MALAVAWLGGGGTRGEPISRHVDSGTAVLVLDLQRDFLMPNGRNPIAADQVESVLSAANTVADGGAAAGVEVVYVGNEFPPEARIANLFRRGAALRGSVGAALDPRLHVVGGRYFAKRRGDAFLRERRGGRGAVAGVFPDQAAMRTRGEA